ncbi:UbiH/UbiF family hydroxylase [Alsobacter sp. R-9]
MAGRDSGRIGIVGGGAAGLAAGIALAQKGWPVTLVGPTGARADGRTVALMAGSVEFLRSIGAWECVAPHASPLASLCIIDDTGSLLRAPPVTFHATELDLDAFGYNVESVTLVRAIAETARATAGLELVDDTVETLSFEPGGATLALAGGRTLDVALVVGADGRHSGVREAAGIATKTWSYDQSAVTAILAHDRPHRDTSTEFHTRQGPFTLVPLEGRRSSLVWLTAPARAEELVALPEEAFAREVERQAKSMLGGMRLDGPRGVVPMGGLSVDRFAAGRAALVGEAAHVFPPIGAQGLNLGLRDVAALAKALGPAAGDPGEPRRMEAYDGARRGDVRTRTMAVDALNRSLLAGFLPVDAARGVGLMALSAITPLRRFVMRQGLGASA